MSCVHYKFKSSLEYQSVTFDGIHISLGDLKKAIINQKRMKSGEFDLEITNAQTGEVYKTEDELIPKNSSVIVSRVPVKATTVSNTQKAWEAFKEKCAKAIKQEREQEQLSLEKLKETPDLANAKGSEMDKIKAMIDQSTRDFDPSNYRGKHPIGPPPPGYHCHRCGTPGHYIQNCSAKLDDSKLIVEPRFKRSTGIPASFLTLTDDPTQPGALLTHTGQFAVPTIDAAAYAQGKKERPPFLPDPVDEEPKPQRPPVPKELLCSLCNNLLTDAVLIPCCGISYCDECIRTTLLDTDDRQCPACYKTDVSPDNLIANVQLRTAVVNFLNETGYTAAMFKKKEAPAVIAAAPLHPQTPPSKSSTPTMSQMEEARFEMERSQQHYKDGSPSNSMSSRRSRSEQRGRPLTVLGPSGNNSPSDHNSRPHRPYRERFPPRSSSSYSQHHHQRSWPERGSYSGSQGVKTEPQLPRTSAHPPLISTAPPFTSAPPLLPSPGFPPRPFHPVPQPPPPGVTAPTSTFPPVGLHPFTAPPPSVVPPPVAPYAPPPFVGPAVPGVANHPPPLLAPLTEQEFYREKQRLMEKESSKTDVYEEFANFLKRTTKSNRPRSRSGSPLPNSTARRRSRSYSRSRSRSPSPSRSFRSSRSSPKHSRSPRSRSPRPHTPRSRTSRSPSYSSVRSRSRGRPRTRSRSRTPLRSSSRSPRTRGGKRYRSRSYSRSPNYRGSPRRSRSRSRVRGRSPPRRGYRSPSRSRSRSRSPSTRYSRSSSRSPRRRRSPMRFGRKRSSPSLSRSRSRSPFKEPLGAPTRPNWHNYRSPPPTANRNFPPQNLGPRYQPPGGPSGPFPNGPVFNFPGQVPVQRPSYFGGDFFPPQFPNQTRHPGPIPLMQIMPHGPRPPFDRQYYDNRGGPLPFGGPGPNSPPRAKSPFRSRMPGERRPDNRRDVRNRNTGERWEFGRRDGQDRRDVVQRHEAASGDRREGGMKRKTDMGNAAAAPGGASANAGQATETRLKKVRKVKKRLVDGKKENKEGPSEKEGTIKKKGERVSSKSRHSSGASQDKLQERKVVVGQETPDASKPSKPSAEKTTPPPSTSAKDIGNSERQVVKADTSRELPRKVVSAADLPTKPQVAASNPPVVEVKTAVPSQNSSESAPDETSSSNTKLKKKIRVKNPVATVAAAASAAAASVNAASFNAASVNAASVNAASGKVDDNQKKLMRLKRFQSDSGSSKGASPPKKMNREPTPPGLGKPMDLRLGEPRHRDGPDYDLPELSKWERDDVSRSPTENFNPRRKVVEKKPLPRSVIEKAESVLANKPIKPSVKPTTGGASPAKPARRVYVEENGSPKCTESEDKKGSSAMQITVSKTQRRVSESRHTHTSDRQHQDADVRRVAKSDHHKQVAPESERRRHHLSSADTARKSVIDSDHHRRAVSSADHQKKVSSDSERSKRTSLEPDPRKRADNSSEHHRRADSSDHQRRGDNSSDYQKRGDNRSDHQKRSDGSSDRHRHKTSTSDLHRRGEDSRLMSESVSHDKSSHSHSSRETKKTDWVSSSSKPAVETGKGKAEEKAPAPKEEKVQSSDSASAEDSQKPKETKSYLFDRKESMMDEATFEPDYDEQSGSESSVEETTTAGEQVSTLSSGTDRSSASPSKRGVQSQDLSSGHHKKSKKKHKHKSKHKHKHKKRKHKKNKGKVVESEDV